MDDLGGAFDSMQLYSSEIEQILSAAVEIESAVERREFVERSCGEDAELRCRVEQLIEHHFRAENFLETPVIQPSEIRKHGDLAGAMLGDYKLIRKIGEGGMGVVWMAEQTHPVQRQVALKIIKLGIDTNQVIARFEAERQALALMDHPNIAKVLDAGTTDALLCFGDRLDASNGGESPQARRSKAGVIDPWLPIFCRPYFVMELVNGTPITKYCDERQLTPRQRLELFLPVCHAIQHAHQKGIIHRDIKPSNVLVAEYDGKPVVKVIDFGVAKATQSKLTEQTLYTHFGQIIGTLEYMSPEQAKFNTLDVDTRSDVYSLGVLLYELLTGTTPFVKDRFEKSALDEMLRVIREEEVQKPSTRLSKIDTVTAIANDRNTDPRQLTRQIRGELDWIVMKCLEKERSQRYATANDIAADLQRYLVHEPTQVGPPSWGYHLRKMVRRHRGLVIGSALLLVVLLIGAIGTTTAVFWGLEKKYAAQRAEQEAENQRKTAQERELWIRRSAYLTDLMEYQTRSNHDPEWVRGMLSRHLPKPGEMDLRGVEWELISQQWNADKPCKTLSGHTSDVRTVAFSPDSSTLATASWDGSIGLWDVLTGMLQARPLRGHVGEVHSVAFSPDGKKLVSGGGDWCVRLWDVAARKQLKLVGMTPWHHIKVVAFAPDGQSVFAGSDDRSVYHWDLASGKLLHRYDGFDAPVESLAVSATGDLLVASCRNGTKLWQLATGREMFRLAQGGTVSFHPDQERIFLASENFIFQFDKRGILLLAIPAQGPQDAFAIHPLHPYLMAAGGTSAHVWLWDTRGQPLKIMGKHEQFVWCCRFSPDGRWLATSSRDRTVHIWDLNQIPRPEVIQLRKSCPRCAQLHPKGLLLYTGHQDGSIIRWHVPDRQSIKSWKPVVWPVTSLALLPGQRMAIATHQPTICGVIDLRQGGLHVYSQGPSASMEVVLAGHLLAAQDEDHPNDGTANLSAITRRESNQFGKSHEILSDVSHTNPYSAIAFHPDARIAAIGDSKGFIHLYDLESSSIIQSFHASSAVTCLAFSRDGLMLAVGDTSGRIRFLDLNKSHDNLSPEIVLPAIVNSVAFSPDDQTLAAGCEDGWLRLINIPTRGKVYARSFFGIPICSILFTPDGQTLIAVAGNKHTNEGEICFFPLKASR